MGSGNEIVTWHAISSAEQSLPLSSGTGKRFPAPLDKGNGGSGDEIAWHGGLAWTELKNDCACHQFARENWG